MHPMLKRSLDLTLNLSSLPPPLSSPLFSILENGFLTLINGTWCLNLKKKRFFGRKVVSISFNNSISLIAFFVNLNNLLSSWAAFRRFAVNAESLGINLLSHDVMSKNLLISFGVLGSG